MPTRPAGPSSAGPSRPGLAPAAGRAAGSPAAGVFAAALALGLAAPAAAAGPLPGVDLPMRADESGRLVLDSPLPEAFVAAGVAPGWALLAVEGQKVTDAAAAARQAGAGPARPLQLLFSTPQGETVLVVQRAPLVQVDEIGLLPWPEGYRPGSGPWQVAVDGRPLLPAEDGGPWALDLRTGALTPAPGAQGQDAPLPAVFWALTDAAWLRSSADGAPTVSDGAGFRQALGAATRVRSFQGRGGDHLLLPTAEGLEVLAVSFPAGTPELPLCSPEVPETCLVAGRQIAAELSGRPGGREEALRSLGLACEGGVYRACLEAVALEEPPMAARVRACTERVTEACHEVGRHRLDQAPSAPTELTLGVLEYACSVDASGSLGERLRRTEMVGEGCWMLARAFGAAGVADRALLSLDQACVLGRAEACDEAGRRRDEAFALRTVRECEDPALPLASACVQLGHLLQDRTIQATTLDGFGAWLRACELGDEEGCMLLGDYVDRWGISHPRVVGAEAQLMQACRGGEQRACVGAGHLLVRHDPRSEEYGKALTLFATACAEGLPGACIAGAEQRRIGAARKLEAPAQLELWDKACALDSAPGCDGYGDRLSRARDSWEGAFTAWTKACDTGAAGACTSLGRFVDRTHEPLWPGEQPAPQYLTRGCENGDPAGCYWLGMAEVPRKGDPPEPAYLLLERSCDGEYGEGCAELGRVHLQRKTSFDDEIAAGLLQRACDNADFESCRVLGEMYQRGKGVEKDRMKSRELAQRYSVNATRRHVRAGIALGFPYVAAAGIELVAPIPVGPAIAVAGSYTYLPGLGGPLMQLKGESYPDDPPDLQYFDAGLKLYPNNKARGIYGMVAWHQLQAQGGELDGVLTRAGPSARLGMHVESRAVYTAIEMGIGSYGIVLMNDFDEDETGQIPLIQATLGVRVGVAVF